MVKTLSELEQKQFTFSRLLPELIEEAYRMGFHVKMGETWRDPRIAELNAKSGAGIKNSLHILRLAVDVLLFKDGQWLKDTSDYKKLGEYWKSLSTPGFECCWGGDFKSRPDGGHFSISHDGVK